MTIYRDITWKRPVIAKKDKKVLMHPSFIDLQIEIHLLLWRTIIDLLLC